MKTHNKKTNRRVGKFHARTVRVNPHPYDVVKATPSLLIGKYSFVYVIFFLLIRIRSSRGRGPRPSPPFLRGLGTER